MSSHVTEKAACLADPRSDQLRALPARYYIEEKILALETERLFFKTWQYACHVSELEEPGAYATTEVLGQNVFVIRDHNGEINAFYNVCPHRGHKLVEGMGNKRVIVCPYHQWSYSLDGKLRHNRKSPKSETPGKGNLCLTPVRVDRLLDFVLLDLQ